MYRRTYLCVLCCAVVCESMCSERFVLFWFTKLPHCTELISIANLNIVVLYTYPHTYVFLFVVIVIRENGSPVVIMAFATSTTSPVLGCCSTALLVFTSSLASHNKTHKQLWGVTAASRNESCSNDDDDVDGDGDGKDASSGGSSYKNAHSQMCRLQSQRMHTHTHTSARGYNAHTHTQTRLSAEAGKKFRKACKKYIVLRVRERESASARARENALYEAYADAGRERQQRAREEFAHKAKDEKTRAYTDTLTNTYVQFTLCLRLQKIVSCECVCELEMQKLYSRWVKFVACGTQVCMCVASACGT